MNEYYVKQYGFVVVIQIDHKCGLNWLIWLAS